MLCKWASRLYSTFKISKKMSINHDKCYFRYMEIEDKVDITFLLKIKDSLRQFNLSRKPTESLEALLSRIAANVEKSVKKAFKKQTPNGTDEKEYIFYDIYNNTISNKLLCRDLFDIESPVKIKIYDQVYDIVFNSPWVVSISVPQSILAGFPIYPENFETLFTVKEKTSFNWYTGEVFNEKGNEKSESHIIWDLVGKGYVFTPTTKHIGRKIKLECIPGNDNKIGPAVEAISTTFIEAGPGTCPFENRHKFTKTRLQDKSFRCVTYNILADLYCDSEFTRTTLHPYCPPYALHIDYRKQLIVKELLGYNSDIMCLQEVDKKIFNNCLQPLFGSEYLEGKFYKKGKEVAEGLACFYRTDRFRFVEDDCMVLAEAIQLKTCLQPIWREIESNKPLIERLLNRSTVASATCLALVDDPSQLLIVGNTHLYFHPDADHIRLIQGGMVIYWLQDIIQESKKKYQDKRISLILCGDFNSVPSCGIYQLYTRGFAPDTLADWKSNSEEAVKGLSLRQGIPLSSACGTPPFTNFTAGFADCLDYIFYDTSSLQVGQVIPLPSLEELQANTALPSVVFPSDHISLVADLKFN